MADLTNAVVKWNIFWIEKSKYLIINGGLFILFSISTLNSNTYILIMFPLYLIFIIQSNAFL